MRILCLLLFLPVFSAHPQTIRGRCYMIDFLERLIERRGCRKSIVQRNSCYLAVTVEKFIHSVKEAHIIYIFDKAQTKSLFYIFRQIRVCKIKLLGKVVH